MNRHMAHPNCFERFFRPIFFWKIPLLFMIGCGMTSELIPSFRPLWRRRSRWAVLSKTWIVVNDKVLSSFKVWCMFVVDGKFSKTTIGFDSANVVSVLVITISGRRVLPLQRLGGWHGSLFIFCWTSVVDEMLFHRFRLDETSSLRLRRKRCILSSTFAWWCRLIAFESEQWTDSLLRLSKQN